MKDELLFAERQRFTQWWVWAILFICNGLFAYGVIKQVIYGREFGSKPMSDVGLLIAFGFFIILTILFFNVRLDTTIRASGIYIRFFPLHRRSKFLSWDKISKLYIRKYGAIREYGGWGLRFGLFGKGKAYTVSGVYGLQIELTSREKLLIGTNKPEQLKVALDKMVALKAAYEI